MAAEIAAVSPTLSSLNMRYWVVILIASFQHLVKNDEINAYVDNCKFKAKLAFAYVTCEKIFSP